MITNDDVRLIVDILLQQLKVIAENVHRRDSNYFQNFVKLVSEKFVQSSLISIYSAKFFKFQQGFVPYFHLKL